MDIDYDDDSAGDLWVDSTIDQPTAGFWVELEESGAPFWSGWLNQSNPHRGCTPEFTLDDAESYDLTIFSKAKINDIEIEAYDSVFTQNLTTGALLGFVPTQDEVLYSNPLPGSTEPRWNHLILVAFALARHDASIVGTLPVYNNPGFCCSGSETSITLGDTKRKFLVAHEVGHWVASKADSGGTGFSFDYSAAEDGCHGDTSVNPSGSHGQLTKEFQSAAAFEGIADWYSAITFNLTGSGQDCEFQRWYGIDWNDDGTVNVADTVPHQCHGDPFAGVPDYVGQKDWLEDVVIADDDDVDMVQCQGTLANRSTPYDWQRYLWAMRTVEGLPVSKVWEAIDAADPHNWSADDSGAASTMPASRWEGAIDSLGAAAAAAHDNQEDHGLDH